MDRALMGKFGEDRICDYLIKKGYTISCRNYFSRFGEVDIIAENNDVITFVEVKTRTTNCMVTGIEAVTKSKQKKIIKTAQDYLIKHSCGKQPRFDIAQVEIKLEEDRKLCRIQYIDNAFDASNIFSIL